jgi:hypothetical protein
MANVTADRDTLAKGVATILDDRSVATGFQPFAGAMVGVDANGRAVRPGAGSTAIAMLGRVEVAEVAATANDQYVVRSRTGIFKYDNHPGDTVTNASLGADCWADDDQTVANAATGSRTLAGRVFEIDADGSVWVSINFPHA